MSITLNKIGPFDHVMYRVVPWLNGDGEQWYTLVEEECDVAGNVRIDHRRQIPRKAFLMLLNSCLEAEKASR
ncbi:MAG: hypothetical protein KGO96_10160 [Elusimicrobia bacterium]|nr:hypothetical protein [Elusimicrobiota bacterium]